MTHLQKMLDTTAAQHVEEHAAAGSEMAIPPRQVLIAEVFTDGMAHGRYGSDTPLQATWPPWLLLRVTPPKPRESGRTRL